MILPVSGIEAQAVADEYKSLEPIACVITKVTILDCAGSDFYEIVVKENGSSGMLICGKRSRLSEGQEVIGEFCGIDPDGRYILASRFPPNLNVVRPSGGAKIIDFPPRESDP